MPKFPVLTALLTILLLAASVPFTPAQQTASGQDAQNQNGPQGDTNDPAATLRGNVDVVQLFFNVKDRKGGLIPSLTKDDFDILEDAKQQTIKYFTAESNFPLTLGILIDSSGSQQNVLQMEKEVGGAFLSDILREKDEAFVISFDVNIDLLQDFTTSTHLLKAALNTARINTGGGSCGGIPGMGGGPVPCTSAPKGTLLYDAVYLASHDELAKEV